MARRKGISRTIVDAYSGAESFRPKRNEKGLFSIEIPSHRYAEVFEDERDALIAGILVGSYPSKTKKQRLQRDFALNPTPRKYVQTRRDNPRFFPIFDETVTEDCGTLFQQDMALIGLEHVSIIDIQRGEESAISEACLAIIEYQSKFLRSNKSVRRKEIASRSFVEFLIAIIARQYIGNIKSVSADFLAMIYFWTIGHDNLAQERFGIASDKRMAVHKGGQMIAMGQPLSIRAVAQEMGLAPSTVLRWFKGDDFEQLCRDEARIFDAKGHRLKRQKT
ncbi:MAG: hypothetical protein IOC59_00445 [Methylobacterium sp.]|nr:hypothetical protein [Methylobacterium sp.]MCA3602610.1 hypothetical protein [Methylobacterium sp.]MCA3613672.1 hypothetical protein [Methylobacterium sp.]